MLAFAAGFPEWKDFPKGMQVMVVDEDRAVLEDVKLKLEACGYGVTAYCKEKDALEALEDGRRPFHVAVVEATVSDTLDGFKIVAAAARHLTTIMIAGTENMDIMMQGIAAGASEFLQKPLSEEKLRNIWQHVVRKALSSGHAPLPINDPLNVKQGLADIKCELSSGDTAREDEEIDSTDLFINQGTHAAEEGSIFFLGDEQKPDSELLCYTPPLLEQSSRAVMEEEDAVSGDGRERERDDAMERGAGIPGGGPLQHRWEFAHRGSQPDAYGDNCEEYMQVKAEVEEAASSSEVLNELFDSQARSYALDYSHIEASMAEDGDDSHRPVAMEDQASPHDQYQLQYQYQDQQQQDDCMFAQHTLDPRLCDELGLGLVDDDGDLFSLTQEGSFFAASSDFHEHAPANRSAPAHHRTGITRLEHDDDGNEEALLLAEVAKADMQHAFIPGGPGVNDAPALSTSTTGDSKSDSEHSGCKGASRNASKKKMKVDWSPELHRRFVQVVEQLGVDKAIPSRILEIMGVKCLTRHNIASHLQKYRSHRKHVQAREAGAMSSNWKPAGASTQIHPRPCGPQLHVWGHPTAAAVQAHAPTHGWRHHGWPPQQLQIDAWWAHPPTRPVYPPAPPPVLRLPLAPVPTIANAAVPAPRQQQATELCNGHPANDAVDASINEVLRNPFVPLPLGLTPPSLESVVLELQRQGIAMASSGQHQPNLTTRRISFSSVG